MVNMELNQHEKELIYAACNDERSLSTLSDEKTWKTLKRLTNYTDAQIQEIISKGHNKKDYILQQLQEGRITDNTKNFACILCMAFAGFKIEKLRNRGLTNEQWEEFYEKIQEYIKVIIKLDPKSKDDPSIIEAIKNLDNAKIYRNSSNK